MGSFRKVLDEDTGAFYWWSDPSNGLREGSPALLADPAALKIQAVARGRAARRAVSAEKASSSNSQGWRSPLPIKEEGGRAVVDELVVGPSLADDLQTEGMETPFLSPHQSVFDATTGVAATGEHHNGERGDTGLTVGGGRSGEGLTTEEYQRQQSIQGDSKEIEKEDYDGVENVDFAVGVETSASEVSGAEGDQPTVPCKRTSWQKVWDKNTEHYYYWDADTGECQWEKPKVFVDAAEEEKQPAV